MGNYTPPLSVFFIWHPADAKLVAPIVEYCYSQLSRDINKPFSRSMNLPVFIRTSLNIDVPTQVEITSAQTIIFVFISKEVIADDKWSDYIENLPQSESAIIIPVAVDKTALKVCDLFENKNFIRAYEYSLAYRNEYMFIAIANEIYRWGLNKPSDKTDMGRDKAIKLFLSHTKLGESGEKLAKALKTFIDNSQMQNFFDTTDIAIGYKFDNEIIEHIKGSTIIAVHSDNYSSRYWCQREILCAKENDRPIIAVDALDDFEDRIFPFASNIPCVHVAGDSDPTELDLLRILCATLLETIRFFYTEALFKEYKKAGWIKSDAETRSRPPDISDLEKILSYEQDGITYRNNLIIYPEPPLYMEELKFLSNLNIKVKTPLTADSCELQNKNIGISISDPSEEELISIGQNKKHLIQLSQDVARYSLARNATVIYGGDLRPNGFTQFIFNEAQIIKARMPSQNIHIKNYIAWPIYIKDSEEFKLWKAENKTISQMIECAPSADVKDLLPNADLYLQPTNIENRFVWSRCLTEMREKMIKDCAARICAGGKYSGYLGIMPGVLEEIIIAIELRRPVYLLGGFGGVTSGVCRLIQTGTLPQELTQDWQVHNNAGYQELLDFSAAKNINCIAYNRLTDVLKSSNLNNGLNEEDNEKLFNTPFIEEAIQLIFKGLRSVF